MVKHHHPWVPAVCSSLLPMLCLLHVDKTATVCPSLSLRSYASAFTSQSFHHFLSVLSFTCLSHPSLLLLLFLCLQWKLFTNICSCWFPLAHFFRENKIDCGFRLFIVLLSCKKLYNIINSDCVYWEHLQLVRVMHFNVPCSWRRVFSCLSPCLFAVAVLLRCLFSICLIFAGIFDSGSAVCAFLVFTESVEVLYSGHV